MYNVWKGNNESGEFQQNWVDEKKCTEYCSAYCERTMTEISSFKLKQKANK